MTFDIQLARVLALESSTAYSGAQITASNRVTGAAARMAYNADAGALIVAFKGSSTPKDFIQDAKFVMEPLIFPALPTDHAVEVHSGFLEDFDSVAEDVNGYVRSHLFTLPKAKLYLTGHSLGGALAILCALEMTRNNIPVEAVYTFGQPRVGNRQFADLYNSTPLRESTFRIVNENDIVPRTPGLLMGYRHCGQEAFLSTDGEMLINPAWWQKGFSDVLGAYSAYRQRQDVLIREHFIAAYLAKLAATT